MHRKDNNIPLKPKPTLNDLKTSLEDARFFYQKLEPIIRGPEQDQDLEVVRCYFRAYLHCWKCILYFVPARKDLNSRSAWIAWSDK
jgi:hypothetical protein